MNELPLWNSLVSWVQGRIYPPREETVPTSEFMAQNGRSLEVPAKIITDIKQTRMVVARKLEARLQEIDLSLTGLNGHDLDIEFRDLRAPDYYFYITFKQPGFYRYPEIPQAGYAAVIRNIKVPYSLQNMGLGTRIVKTFEDVVTGEGIRLLAASEIRSKDAEKFWIRNGYLIPQEELLNAPRLLMYKIIN